MPILLQDLLRPVAPCRAVRFSGRGPLFVTTDDPAISRIGSNPAAIEFSLPTGCIIRAALLEDICAAFHARRELPNLLLARSLSRKVMKHQECLRQVVCHAAELGVPIPGLMVSLGYLDAYRSAWLPANLIQAQRDYFGAHTYERLDAKGTFHTEWEKE
jgi:6-phosphogluconate dehydrogenase